jgi:hypothetical protein
VLELPWCRIELTVGLRYDLDGLSEETARRSGEPGGPGARGDRPWLLSGVHGRRGVEGAVVWLVDFLGVDMMVALNYPITSYIIIRRVSLLIPSFFCDCREREEKAWKMIEIVLFCQFYKVAVTPRREKERELENQLKKGLKIREAIQPEVY